MSENVPHFLVFEKNAKTSFFGKKCQTIITIVLLSISRRFDGVDEQSFHRWNPTVHAVWVLGRFSRSYVESIYYESKGAECKIINRLLWISEIRRTFADGIIELLGMFLKKNKSGPKFINRIMSAILFFRGLYLFHLPKIENIDLVFVLADPYYPCEKMIRFDLSFKMAAVGAPGPHGTFVPIAIKLIISKRIPSRFQKTLRLATKGYLKFSCNLKLPKPTKF